MDADREPHNALMHFLTIVNDGQGSDAINYRNDDMLAGTIIDPKLRPFDLRQEVPVWRCYDVRLQEALELQHIVVPVEGTRLRLTPELRKAISEVLQVPIEMVGEDEAGIYYCTTKNPNGRFDDWCVGGIWSEIWKTQFEGRSTIAIARSIVGGPPVPHAYISPANRWYSIRDASEDAFAQSLAEEEWKEEWFSIWAEIHPKDVLVAIDCHIDLP